MCYQLPAVMRHTNTAELTVVISPLVALMVDQVDGMRRRGIDAVVTLNSLLSAPERTQALEQIVSGEAGIALIAPESLRSRPVRKALEQRLIGAWVIDEAHCVSKWGHDFRPEYRYVARFMRKRCADEAPPTLLALTATAKHEVIDDIRRHFETVLGIELSVIDAGAKRGNLDYQILPKSGGTNADAVWSVLNEARSDTPGAAAIVYCITRRETETLAQALCERGLKAGPFHGNLRPERKKTIQDGFMSGELNVVVATKAFGMGVDKPDVRMVIHTGVPSSLEDYYQEAGRAGRDQQPAQCVLLYHEDDVERQLRLAATGRVGVRDVQGTLKALRAMRRRRSRHKLNGRGDEVVATVGEILAEDDTGILDDEPGNTDVRMRVVLAQLEVAEPVAQEEHAVRVYPSSVKVPTVDAANRRIDDARRVQIMTCHSFAMWIVGRAAGEAKERWTDEDFREVLREAARTLREESEGSMSRDRLMQRYHWILVDEYQDIGEDEYELISALAGLSLADEDARIQLFAVGDDDQNVYGFKGASVEFIRRQYMVQMNSRRQTALVIMACHR